MHDEDEVMDLDEELDLEDEDLEDDDLEDDFPAEVEEEM